MPIVVVIGCPIDTPDIIKLFILYLKVIFIVAQNSIPRVLSIANDVHPVCGKSASFEPVTVPSVPFIKTRITFALSKKNSILYKS